jgi:hypothetical protein
MATNPSPILQLPTELAQRIASYLGPFSQHRLRMTCGYFRKTIKAVTKDELCPTHWSDNRWGSTDVERLRRFEILTSAWHAILATSIPPNHGAEVATVSTTRFYCCGCERFWSFNALNVHDRLCDECMGYCRRCANIMALNNMRWPGERSRCEHCGQRFAQNSKGRWVFVKEQTG